MAAAKLLKNNTKSKSSKGKTAKGKSLLPKDIKKIRDYDRQMFRALFVCGHISEKNLNKLMTDIYGNNHAHRLETWRKNGFIVPHNEKSKIGSRVFSLTKLGVKLCTREPGLKFEGSHQTTDDKKLRHNLGLSHKYMSLTPAQRESCRAETTIRDQDYKELVKELQKEILRRNEELERIDEQRETEEYKTKENELAEVENRYYNILGAWEDKRISTPDMSYVDESGQVVYYEVVTSAYEDWQIAAKVEFARLLGNDIILQRI